MGYYLVTIDNFDNDDENINLEITDFFEMIKKNTWVFKHESIAQKHIQQLQNDFQYSVTKFDLNIYRSVVLVGEFKIKKNTIRKYQLIRPCLTHNYLPEQIIDPQLKKVNINCLFLTLINPSPIKLNSKKMNC